MNTVYIVEKGCQLNIHMKNNKGYYSWIHSLNEAAVKSQINGFEMLNEASKGPTRAVRNYLPGQTERPITPGTDFNQRLHNVSAGLGTLLAKSGMTEKEMEPHAGGLLYSGRRELERPGSFMESDPASDIGDVGPLSTAQLKQEMANASVAKMKAATAAANAARAQGPVNAKPTGNANAVAMDAKDGEMADPEFVAPPERVHPEPQFKSAAEAEAFVKAHNAMKFAQENPMTDEEIAEREPSDEDELYRLSTPSAKWKTVKEDRKTVSNKITKLIQEANRKN